jgi:succinate-semialdehyde dehydrogenase/glutarate-semialdehyde dehydrogenase
MPSTPSAPTPSFPLPEPLHLIEGKRVPSASEETIRLSDPSTGEFLAEVPAGCAQDAAAGVQAAVAAKDLWRRTSPGDRASALKAAARRLRESVDELTEIQSRESGKPPEGSRGGVMAGIETIEQYAELGPLHRGQSLQGNWNSTDLMVFEPRGVAVVLTPWNDPIAICAQLIAAALVAGNPVVFSPSERTPLSGIRFAEIVADELPPGVLNLVLGDARVGRPLVENPDVDLVLHIGSSITGRHIAEACAATGAHAVLEGGGKDPCIVDADVDPAWAASQAALGAFANTGQICTSVERIYVHRDIAEPFVDALVEEAGKQVIGSALDPSTTMGPMVDNAQRSVVDRHVREAVDAGAEVRTGGAVPEGAGSFYPPTVLVGCTPEMAVMREETFGPVAAVQVVDSFDDALAVASVSDFGLAGTVLTANLTHAQEAWRSLPVGTVKINAVFGGAPGGSATPGPGSGQGFGYGPELLDECTRVKVVHLEPAIMRTP